MEATRVENRHIPGPYGEIPIRIYEPAEGTALPIALVWAHGGAFVGGDLDMPEADWVSRTLADMGITVVSVDYRRAPVTDLVPSFGPSASGSEPGRHFPVASVEVGRAFDWARTAFPHISPDRWSLGGASAGADLAASVTMRTVLEGRPAPRSTVLIYPIVHKEMPPRSEELKQTLARIPAEENPSDEAVYNMNLNYVGDPALLDDPCAFPGGHDLRGFPPVFILNSEEDALRASGEAFATELISAGVEVQVVREAGARHGHFNHPENPLALLGVKRVATWLGVPRP